MQAADHRRWLKYIAAVAGAFVILCAAATWAREKARRISCLGNFKSIGLALRMYSGDNQAHFPPSLRYLITEQYLTTAKVYTCPSTGTETLASARLLEFDEERHSDYVYLGSGLTEDCQGQDPARTVLLHDREGNHHQFVNVLFSNGAVEGYRGSSMSQIAGREGLIIPLVRFPGGSTEDDRQE